MKKIVSMIALFAYSIGFLPATVFGQSTASPQSGTSTTTADKSLQDQREVHLIYMGGNDCPPCVAWRKDELPKLQQTDAFKQSKFTYVVKTIGSSVPSGFFLPKEVKEYKAKLDVASGGFSGSPQFALLVNGEIYDYYSGTRDAVVVEKMLRAAKTGEAYPTKRCLLRSSLRTCAKELD